MHDVNIYSASAVRKKSESNVPDIITSDSKQSDCSQRMRIVDVMTRFRRLLWRITKYCDEYNGLDTGCSGSMNRRC